MTKITLRRNGDCIELLNEGGATVAHLQDGADTITYDPLASLDEILGHVVYRDVIRDLGLDVQTIRKIDGYSLRNYLLRRLMS